MDVQEAATTCLSKYVSLEGRADRPEFWWWVLFVTACWTIIWSIGGAVLGADSGAGAVGGGLLIMAAFLPSVAVAVRRLHDQDKTGWWMLLAFVPLIGWAVLLYFMVQPGSNGPNAYGNVPVVLFA